MCVESGKLCQKKRRMPTYPIFHCSICESAVQLESTALKNYFPSSSSSGRASLFSSELDSDDFPRYCRGQGKYYLTAPRDRFASPTTTTTTVGGDHFNFSGIFHGMCCYCALGGGLSLGSFGTLGCHHCLQRFHSVREFSKLKIRTNEEEEASANAATAVGCNMKKKKGGSVWDEQGWGGLSDSLIDHILHLALGEKVILVE